MKRASTVVAICCALLFAAAAAATTTAGHGKKGHAATAIAAPAVPLNWGVADDSSKYADDGGAWFYGEMQGASLTENRWTLAWNPSDPTAITELPFLQRAAPVAQADGIHVVLVLYAGTNGTSAPDATALATSSGALNTGAAAAFCKWAGIVADTVKGWGIHDYVVLNEPNTATYWAPQKKNGKDVAAAPVEKLLARCYDALHAQDAQANVNGLGLSPRASREKTSNDPLSFLRDVGTAYRASHRKKPIMDQIALHPYPVYTLVTTPNGRKNMALAPDRGYAAKGNAANDFSISQLARVKQAVYDAFNGTCQPTTVAASPKSCRGGSKPALTFRLDEVGWQTDTSAYLQQYYNTENVVPISELQQAQYLEQTVQYFACDPTVTDVELFLLVDEATRDGRSADGASVIGGGWQSGLMTAGGEGVSTPKVAYSEVGTSFGQGRAACRRASVTWTPSPGRG